MKVVWALNIFIFVCIQNCIASDGTDKNETYTNEDIVNINVTSNTESDQYVKENRNIDKSVNGNDKLLRHFKDEDIAEINRNTNTTENKTKDGEDIQKRFLFPGIFNIFKRPRYEIPPNPCYYGNCHIVGSKPNYYVNPQINANAGNNHNNIEAGRPINIKINNNNNNSNDNNNKNKNPQDSTMGKLLDKVMETNLITAQMQQASANNLDKKLSLLLAKNSDNNAYSNQPAVTIEDVRAYEQAAVRKAEETAVKVAGKVAAKAVQNVATAAAEEAANKAAGRAFELSKQKFKTTILNSNQYGYNGVSSSAAYSSSASNRYGQNLKGHSDVYSTNIYSVRSLNDTEPNLNTS